MGIVGNYSVIHKSPARFMSGSGLIVNRASFSKSGAFKNAFFSFAKFSAVPNGYLHPYCFVMPRSAGGMASYTQARGETSVTLAQLYAGRNLDASANIIITLTNADLDQVIALVGSAILSIGQTNAGLSAAVSLSANGTIDLTTLLAQLGGIFSVNASGVLTINPNVVMTAIAHIGAVSGGPTELSPEGIAQAVWNYLKENPTQAGSMKDILQKAKTAAETALAVSV